MPIRKMWDHIIDLKKEFKASKTQMYPLSRNEREEVQQFIQDHLRKENIRPSKSPDFFSFLCGKEGWWKAYGHGLS